MDLKEALLEADHQRKCAVEWFDRFQAEEAANTSLIDLLSDIRSIASGFGSRGRDDRDFTAIVQKIDKAVGQRIRERNRALELKALAAKRSPR